MPLFGISGGLACERLMRATGVQICCASRWIGACCCVCHELLNVYLFAS